MKMINIAFTDYIVVRMISLVAKYCSDHYIRPADLDEKSNQQVSKKTILEKEADDVKKFALR